MVPGSPSVPDRHHTLLPHPIPMQRAHPPSPLHDFSELPFRVFNEKAGVYNLTVPSENSLLRHEFSDAEDVQEVVGPPPQAGPKYHPVVKFPEGYGPYANIRYAVRCEDPSHMVVALKEIRLPHTDPDAAELSFAIIEIIDRRSKMIAHDNLGRILAVEDSGCFGEVPFVLLPVLVLPLYLGGDILQYTNDNQAASKINLVTQACAGLAHLHDSILLHGNVGPSNILIENGQAVLCDWGISIALRPLLSEYNGIDNTWVRTAPEMLSASEFKPTTAGDVFSFSVTVYEVFVGELRHVKKETYARGVLHMTNYGITLDKPQEISPELWAILEQGWAYNPISRPPAARVHQQLLSLCTVAAPPST